MAEKNKRTGSRKNNPAETSKSGSEKINKKRTQGRGATAGKRPDKEHPSEKFKRDKPAASKPGSGGPGTRKTYGREEKRQRPDKEHPSEKFKRDKPAAPKPVSGGPGTRKTYGREERRQRPDKEHPSEKFKRDKPAAPKPVSGGPGSRKAYDGKEKRQRPDKEHPFEKFKRDKPAAPKPVSGGPGHKKAYEGKDKRQQPEKKIREPEEVRLNRFIAKSGVCSRREADEHIIGGHVTVNDSVVKELGSKVAWTDVVRFKGKKLNPEKKVYILLNKPKDYITTVDDPYAKRTVMELVRNSCRERIYPVGRLDRHSTGLLLFTNDGELTKKLTHPSHKVIKIYQVGLDRNLEKADLEKIAAGIELEDGPVKADEIDYIDMSDKTQVGIRLHSGKNRIIRRIFKHFEYKVVKLDRVFFAGLTKKNLPRGKWRFLTEKEVGMLKMNIFQ